MKKLENILLMVNPAKNIDQTLIDHLVNRLRLNGCRMTYCDTNGTDEGETDHSAHIPEDTDAAVVLGGDGSIIDAAHRVAGCGIPLIGVNFGRIGFLAEIEIGEIPLFDEILRGNYTIEERMMLDVSVVDEAGQVRFARRCLNDAVLTNGPVARILRFDIAANGIKTQTCLADGIIACTPTGSTAYSLSAGGPVLEPTLDCICLTPICPHTLNNRPVILNGDSVIELCDITAKGTSVYLTTDGRAVFSLDPGDKVVLRKSAYKTGLIRVKDDGFLGVLRCKLSANI